MNSAVRPNFNENFVEKSTCGSHEQYTRLTIQKQTAWKCTKRAFQSGTIYNLLNLYIQNFFAHIPHFSSQQCYLLLLFLECLPSKVNT